MPRVKFVFGSHWPVPAILHRKKMATPNPSRLQAAAVRPAAKASSDFTSVIHVFAEHYCVGWGLTRVVYVRFPGCNLGGLVLKQDVTKSSISTSLLPLRTWAKSTIHFINKTLYIYIYIYLKYFKVTPLKLNSSPLKALMIGRHSPFRLGFGNFSGANC